MSKLWFTDDYLAEMGRQYPALTRDEIVGLLKRAEGHNKRTGWRAYVVIVGGVWALVLSIMLLHGGA